MILPKPPYKIILVDDEEIVLDTTSEFLRIWQHEPICFTDAREAVKHLSVHENAFNTMAIISDVMMPHMSGREFREELLKNSNTVDIPFLAFTGEGDLEERKKTIAAKVWWYIPKPLVDPDDLKIPLDTLIQIRQNHLLESMHRDLAEEKLKGAKEMSKFFQSVLERFSKLEGRPKLNEFYVEVKKIFINDLHIHEDKFKIIIQRNLAPTPVKYNSKLHKYILETSNFYATFDKGISNKQLEKVMLSLKYSDTFFVGKRIVLKLQRELDDVIRNKAQTKVG